MEENKYKEQKDIKAINNLSEEEFIKLIKDFNTFLLHLNLKFFRDFCVKHPTRKEITEFLVSIADIVIE